MLMSKNVNNDVSKDSPIGPFVLLFLKRRFKRKGCKGYKNGKQGKGLPRGVVPNT